MINLTTFSNKLKNKSPIIMIIVLLIVLWRFYSLQHNTNAPSFEIQPSKHAPAFKLPELFEPTRMITDTEFKGHITLLHIWSSWCYACTVEHNFLLDLSKDKRFVLIGLNYNDDLTEARKWLIQFGNPYQLVAVDQKGSAVMDWGMTATPETFVIDKNGFIRYTYVGAISAEQWHEKLLPIINQLEMEA